MCKLYIMTSKRVFEAIMMKEKLLFIRNRERRNRNASTFTIVGDYFVFFNDRDNAVFSSYRYDRGSEG